MDPGWYGVIAAGIAFTGGLVVQRYAFDRVDAGVRRAVRTQLRLTLEQLDSAQENFWLPRFRSCVKLTIERAGEANAATALNNSQHFAVGKAADELRSMARWIESEREDLRSMGQPIDLPSDEEYFGVDEPLRKRLAGACGLVAEALRSLGDQKYVNDLEAQRRGMGRS